MSSEPLERGPVKHNYQLRALIKAVVEQTVKCEEKSCPRKQLIFW